MKQLQRTSRQYQVGSQSFDIPHSAQRKFTGIDVVFGRESWPAGVAYITGDGTVVQNSAMVVEMLRTLDGVNFETVGVSVLPGGTLIHPGTKEVVTESRVKYSFADAQGNPIAQDGDLRARVSVLVPLRTAVTLIMLETTD